MNTADGSVYPFPEGFSASPGDKVTERDMRDMEVTMAQRFTDVSDQLERERVEAESRERFARLDAAVRRGEPIVAVSAEVVQRLRLGDREMRRRKQRRRH